MELQSKAQSSQDDATSSQVMQLEDDKRNMTGRISSLEEEKDRFFTQRYYI